MFTPQCAPQPVTLQCVHSSIALDSLALYSVFTPALHFTACQFRVCSLQDCTSQPVTVHYVHCSSAFHSLSLYSVFTPAFLFAACHCTLFIPAVHSTACYGGLCSIQQCTLQPVTVHCVHSSSALHSLSRYTLLTPARNSTACHCTACSL
jgi:hypothetical protein